MFYSFRKNIQRKVKSILYIFLILLIAFFAIPLINILWYNEPDIITTNNPKDYGVVFGAAIRSKDKLSPTLEARMNDAIELYKQKKIKKLILSGSRYQQIEPGEPKVMEKYAIRNGVKRSDIILDEKGDRTYLTVQNIHYISQLEKEKPSFVFISSAYHMLRIRFLVLMMKIPHSYFYYTKHTSTVFSKEILREIFAFWFYVAYKITYSMR